MSYDRSIRLSEAEVVVEKSVKVNVIATKNSSTCSSNRTKKFLTVA